MHWLEAWIIPPKSVLTGEIGDKMDLTSAELAALPRPQAICPRCAELSADAGLCGSCQHSPPDFDVTQVAFYFQPPVTELIYDLKYHQQFSHARLLAELFYQECSENLHALGLQALLAVPIHPLRRRERGYNQAELIAEVLAKRLAIPLVRNGLQRIKHTATQTHLDAKQRQHNLRGAFSVDPAVLQDYRRVGIVDDVITTGATMQGLAKQLKQKTTIEFIAALAIAKTK